MLLVMWFSFRWSCEEEGVGLSDAYGSLPALDILGFNGSVKYEELLDLTLKLKEIR